MKGGLYREKVCGKIVSEILANILPIESLAVAESPQLEQLKAENAGLQRELEELQNQLKNAETLAKDMLRSQL